MKKNILLPLMSLLFITADAQAQEQCAEESLCASGMNFYAKIFGGANFLQSTTTNGNKSTFNTGYIFSGSLGYCWSTYGLRLEGEYAFRRNGISKMHFFTHGVSEDGHFQTSSYMANLLWDLPLCSWGCSFWKIQPFIGAGIGDDFQKMHSSNSRIVFNQEWNHFSWQVMAGLAYPIFHNGEITVEYKFHQGGCHFNNHSVGVGLAYKFGFFR
jgi:opacity protein-like surface antigen